jgi:hypothetical protein
MGCISGIKECGLESSVEGSSYGQVQAGAAPMMKQQGMDAKHDQLVGKIAMLRLYLDEGMALTKVAAKAGISLRTVRR